MCVVQCVEHVLLESVITRTKRAVDSGKRTVVVAVFLLLLAENLKINLDAKDRQTVFRALLIKPDMEKRTCPDITDLLHHFPNHMKDQKYAMLCLSLMYLFLLVLLLCVLLVVLLIFVQCT